VSVGERARLKEAELAEVGVGEASLEESGLGPLSVAAGRSQLGLLGDRPTNGWFHLTKGLGERTGVYPLLEIAGWEDVGNPSVPPAPGRIVYRPHNGGR